MQIRIESWPMADAGLLSRIWAASSADAPYAFPVGSEEFASRILPVEDEECYATDRSQLLLVASSGGKPVGFAHIGADDKIKIDGEDVECGLIRTMAFMPDCRDAGQALVDRAHAIFLDDGLGHVDAFPIYHGYAFHNFKVGILSDSLTHIVSLLLQNGYSPHDPHITFDRPLANEERPTERDDIDVTIERTDGEGTRPHIRVWAFAGGKTIGNCRMMSGRRYAGIEELEWCAYTRWLGVSESHRRKGIGRHLLQRALYEYSKEGYTTARLNCREKNLSGLSLYRSEGYVQGDRSCAYLKDLGE